MKKEQETTGIKKPKIKSLMNAHDFVYEGEKNFQPSLTVPDQTMPLRTLIERFTRGLPVTTFKPVYDENGNMPDPRKMDLAEYNELRKNVIFELEELHKKQLEEKTQEIENQKHIEVKKLVEEELKRRISTNTP